MRIFFSPPQNPELLRMAGFVPAGGFDQQLEKPVSVSSEPLLPMIEQDLKRQSCRRSIDELC